MRRTGNIDSIQRDGGSRVFRNHDPVVGRRRRPAGHGDGDVRAVIDGEDAVGVGVAAAFAGDGKAAGLRQRGIGEKD